MIVVANLRDVHETISPSEHPIEPATNAEVNPGLSFHSTAAHPMGHRRHVALE